MMKFLVYIKHHLTFIWRIVEIINSFIIGILKGKVLSQLRQGGAFSKNIKVFKEEQVDDLYHFFEEQSEEYLEYFRPHDFNKKTLKRIANENNYLAFCFYDEGKMTGYCFLRLFFNGKAFTGLISHQNYQGQGLGKKMIKVLFEAADQLGVEVFSTISKDNKGSLKSHAAVRPYEVVKELPNDYLMLRFPKK